MSSQKFYLNGCIQLKGTKKTRSLLYTKKYNKTSRLFNNECGYQRLYSPPSPPSPPQQSFSQHSSSQLSSPQLLPSQQSSSQQSSSQQSPPPQSVGDRWPLLCSSPLGHLPVSSTWLAALWPLFSRLLDCDWSPGAVPPPASRVCTLADRPGPA